MPHRSDLSKRKENIPRAVLPDIEPRRWLFWMWDRYVYCDGISFVGQQPDRKRLKPSDVEIGDVLLCVGKRGLISHLIQTATHGPFTHAAIVGNYNLAHESMPSGIGTRPIRKYVENYEYVVVLSHHFLREKSSQKNLILFLEGQKGSYGLLAALRATIQGGMLARKAGRQRSSYRPVTPTCSGFVRRALVACGVWALDQNADLATPTDIANAACFAVRGILSDHWPIVPHLKDSTFSLYDVRECPAHKIDKTTKRKGQVQDVNPTSDTLDRIP
ncbi:hypothetical protein ACVIHI_008749 [Bradyrhizobium sp. USDA 4524]|nr:hypothetical protein [Bradyrhizobium sp. USDA 4538]MCP1906891.1 hypothetical protein [Bradyrhizobium sp. USDA 4537]MCP1985366.1 hypothetical protein [Bradyrhizobium sp. USDA 4539]